MTPATWIRSVIAAYLAASRRRSLARKSSTPRAGNGWTYSVRVRGNWRLFSGARGTGAVRAAEGWDAARPLSVTIKTKDEPGPAQ
jgi:hypothetical protein